MTEPKSQQRWGWASSSRSSHSESDAIGGKGDLELVTLGPPRRRHPPVAAPTAGGPTTRLLGRPLGANGAEDEEAPPPPPLPGQEGATVTTPPASMSTLEKTFGRHPVLRLYHLIGAIVVLVGVVGVYVTHIITPLETEFVPRALPTHFGSIFLLPLLLQVVAAGLSFRYLTSPMWMALVFLWAALCTALLVLDMAAGIVSLVLYAPTITDDSWRAYLVRVGIWVEVLLCVLALVGEHLVLVTTYVLARVAAATATTGRGRPRKPWAEAAAATGPEAQPDWHYRVGFDLRAWLILACMLLFGATAVLYVLHTEDRGSLALDLVTPVDVFFTRATSIWFLLHPLALLLAVVALVVKGRPYVKVLLVYHSVCLALAVAALVTAILAWIYYVPLATTTTGGIAAVLAVTIIAAVAVVGGVAALVFLGLLLRRLEENNVEGDEDEVGGSKAPTETASRTRALQGRSGTDRL